MGIIMGLNLKVLRKGVKPQKFLIKMFWQLCNMFGMKIEEPALVLLTFAF